MKPSEFQKGGKGKLIRYGIVQSYLGWVLVAVSDRGVCRIDFDDSPEILKARLDENFPNAELIRPGTTVSYVEIAKQIGNPKAVRAVAQACGSNSIAVAIPCHRVVRKNGELGGYRWGIKRKEMILEREASSN